MKSPIFLLSMPRSGSTLLQRLLMAHDEIASASEPWILLPLLYANKTEGVISEYSHLNSQKAINDLIEQLPDGDETYYKALSQASNAVYSSLCKNGESYFLDKTPRYYLIIPEIKKLYPDAKFIFLFRNPVEIYASILTTWGNNKFCRLYASHIDLYEGLKRLSDGWHLLHEQAIQVNYEELVKNPESCLETICDYLDIPFNNELVEKLKQQKLTGRLGDPTGVKEYQKVEKASLDKWQSVFNTKLRQQVLKRFINGLDSSTLLTQGYSKHNIMAEIDNMPVTYRKTLTDLADISFYRIAKFINAHLFFTRLFAWARQKYLS